MILHDIANVLDNGNFERLAAHMELRTRNQGSISVGGHGVVEYEERHPEEELVELAKKWLAIEVRKDLER